MKWEKIAQRENDFLKNCLVYEAFVKEFPKAFSRKHPHFLTIRKEMSYTHYFNKESSSELAKFLLYHFQKDNNYINELCKKGRNYFQKLIKFSIEIKNSQKLKKLNNQQLLKLLNQYFQLYKKPYPYFLATADVGVFEKENNLSTTNAINTLAKLRLFGRSSFNQTHQLVEPLFEEIAHRFNLTVKEIKFLTPQEINQFIREEKIGINQLIKDRKNCVFIHTAGNSVLHENCSLVVHEDDVQVEKEIHGQGTFPAQYQGRVKLIKKLEDMQSLTGGEVIVLQMTTTDLITPALKKVGAIITDEGGITCHAAILSREFKIPTIIGTKIATQVLEEGETVLVDAEQGIVKKVENK